MKFFKTVFVLFLIFGAVAAHAQTSAELKKQRENLNQQLEQLNRELERTTNNKNATLQQLNIIKAQISVRQQKIDNINTQVKNLDNQISESTSTVHSLQNQLAQLKKEYEGMVLFAYRNQSAYNKLMFVFAASDFNMAYKRLKYLQQFGAYRERQANYIQGTQKDLTTKIVQLDKDKQEKHSLLVDQEKEKANLSQQKKDQQQTVAELNRHVGQLRPQIQELQARIARNNRAISEAIRREIEEANRRAEEADRLAAAKAAKAAGNKDAPSTRVIAKRTTSEILNSTPEAAKLSNDFLGNKGRLPWPVERGDIIHGFGNYTMQGIRVENTSWEIRTAAGAPVRAVFEGVVFRIAEVQGTMIVLIKHGEYITAYANLRSVSVKSGEKVSTKQNIGTAAVDPSTGDGEVDFSVNKGTTPVDPAGWILAR